MKKHKIAVAVACVVLFTAAWRPIAAGATLTREVLPAKEPWGAGKVFLILGPTHGEVVGEVWEDAGLAPGDYTQVYLSGTLIPVVLPGDFWESFVVLPVPVEGPISIYTFDPADPSAWYEPVKGDVFHLILTGDSYTLPPWEGWIFHPKAELTFPDLHSLFDFDNAPLAEGLRWQPVITPGGGLDLLVVSEPTTAVLLVAAALGFLLVACARERRPPAE
jgi:hypothetical protein